MSILRTSLKAEPSEIRNPGSTCASTPTRKPEAGPARSRLCIGALRPRLDVRPEELTSLVVNKNDLESNRSGQWLGTARWALERNLPPRGHRQQPRPSEVVTSGHQTASLFPDQRQEA